jgi:shikimate kinase
MAGRADPLSELRTLLAEREPLYAEADLTIDTTRLSAEEVAKEALHRLGDWEQPR